MSCQCLSITKIGCLLEWKGNESEKLLEYHLNSVSTNPDFGNIFEMRKVIPQVYRLSKIMILRAFLWD